MANHEDHWHSIEDKLTPSLMVKLFEFLIMKYLQLTMQLVSRKKFCDGFSLNLLTILQPSSIFNKVMREDFRYRNPRFSEE